MGIPISTIKDDLRGVIHGTTVDKITNLYGLFNRTASQVLLDVDLQETRQIQTLAQVFNSVYDYSAPADLKGNRIIDLRPQAGRKGDTWPQRFNQFFDKKKWLKNQNQFTTQHNSGVKSLRIDAPFLTAPTVISDTGSISGWSATGGASGLSVDTKYNVAGSGDLQFNLDGIQEGQVTSSTIASIDLSTHVNISKIFMWVYMPVALTGIGDDGIGCWIGNDSNNYYSMTFCKTQSTGQPFKIGWNLVSFDWDSTTGTPNMSSVNWIQLFFFPNVPITGMKICNITSNLGQYLEAEYYSKYMFRNPTTNVFKEKVVDDSTDLDTLVNVDTESYPVYFNKLCFFIAQQLQGKDATYDVTYWDGEYKNALKRYKNLYPSEVQFAQEPYYEVTKGNYDGFVPKIWTP